MVSTILAGMLEVLRRRGFSYSGDQSMGQLYDSRDLLELILSVGSLLKGRSHAQTFRISQCHIPTCLEPNVSLHSPPRVREAFEIEVARPTIHSAPCTLSTFSPVSSSSPIFRFLTEQETHDSSAGQSEEVHTFIGAVEIMNVLNITRPQCIYVHVR